RVPDDELGRGDGGDVHMRVVDVDADEDRSCDRGADARGLGEPGSGDRHSEVPLSWAGRRTDVGRRPDGRNRRGAGTSPHDVTRGGDFRASGGLEQAETGSAADAAALVFTSSLVKMRLV